VVGVVVTELAECVSKHDRRDLLLAADGLLPGATGSYVVGKRAPVEVGLEVEILGDPLSARPVTPGVGRARVEDGAELSSDGIQDTTSSRTSPTGTPKRPV
jgi:hypothetical protein